MSEGEVRVDGVDAPAPARPLAHADLRVPPDLKLHVDNMEACVRPFSYLTYIGADGLRCLQVLAKRKKIITAKCFDDSDVMDSTTWMWLVQPWEVWRGNEMNLDTEEINVFSLEASCWVDLLSLLSVGEVGRKSWRLWDERPSDLRGTTCLGDPSLIVWKTGCGNSKQRPVLSLIEELQAQGFEPKSWQCEHSRDAPKLYDDRKIVSGRFYIQALLLREKIWERGVATFSSGQIQAYYKVVLVVDPDKIPEGRLSAKTCTRLLEGLPECEFPDLVVVPHAAAPRRPARAPHVDDTIDGGSDQDMVAIAPPLGVHANESIDGDEAEVIDGDEDIREDADCDEEIKEDADEDEVIDMPAAEIEGDTDEEVVDEYPDSVEGVQLCKEVRRGNLEGFRVECPWHIGCGRLSRGVRVDTEIHGKLAPVGYLGAWVAHGLKLGAKKHKSWRPSRDDVRGWLEKNG